MPRLSQIHPALWLPILLAVGVGMVGWVLAQRWLDKKSETSSLALALFFAIPVVMVAVTFRRILDKEELEQRMQSLRTERDQLRERAQTAQRRLTELPE